MPAPTYSKVWEELLIVDGALNSMGRFAANVARTEAGMTCPRVKVQTPPSNSLLISLTVYSIPLG